MFEALLSLNNNDNICLYNLACSEALLGNSEAAISYLKRSVECGYSNLEHMNKDSDLDSIRQLPAFVAIAESLQNKNHIEVKVEEKPFLEDKLIVPEPIISQNPPLEMKSDEFGKNSESEQQNASEPEKLQKQEPDPQPISEDLGKYKIELQLLEDMGFQDSQKNLALLTAENGDLANVISLLFSD